MGEFWRSCNHNRTSNTIEDLANAKSPDGPRGGRINEGKATDGTTNSTKDSGDNEANFEIFRRGKHIAKEGDCWNKNQVAKGVLEIDHKFSGGKVAFGLVKNGCKSCPEQALLEAHEEDQEGDVPSLAGHHDE